MSAATADSPAFRVLGGNPTPAELAAVTAVLTAALDDLASARRRESTPAPSAWDRSRRTPRPPLVRGDWRRFTG